MGDAGTFLMVVSDSTSNKHIGFPANHLKHYMPYLYNILRDYQAQVLLRVPIAFINRSKQSFAVVPWTGHLSRERAISRTLLA